MPKQHYFKKWVKDMLGTADPTEAQLETVLDFFIGLRRDFVVQPNTGYNLLVVGPLTRPGASLAVINPHALPAALVGDGDGSANSRQALHAALDGFVYNLLSVRRSVDRLREKARSAGINC